jgi:hypothetical protein
MALVRGFEKGECWIIAYETPSPLPYHMCFMVGLAEEIPSSREVNVARLNFARIILIPKEEGAHTLKKFRPISLINCSFKIFSNALNNRLEKVCDRLLASNQTAFVKGRFILESVVFAHEILHDAIKKKEKGLVLKLDYEKVYDIVD